MAAVLPDNTPSSKGLDDGSGETEARTRERRHFWSTIGLCGSAFSMFYLIMNVFPYSGFMALHLLNGNRDDLDDDNDYPHRYSAATIGPCAGILVSSFRLGRVPTAIAWGRCADVYGRKFALVVGLLAMVLGNLLFGLAPSFAAAVAIRFASGLLNGTMVVVRTAISEIAEGDEALESRGVAIMSSMSGYAVLVGPAIGGLLSEPTLHHPGWFGGAGSRTELWFARNLLEDYPFLLPNLVGSFVALLSLAIVATCVEETLPEDQLRDWRCVPMDTVQWIEQNFCFVRQKMGCCRPKNRIGISVATEQHPFSNNPLGMGLVLSRSDEATTGALSAKTISINESTPLVQPPALRSSELPALHLESTNEEKDDNTVLVTDETNGGILGFFLNNTTSTVRYFFYSMWLYAFTSLASSETFPLFAITSKEKGGLGMNETDIGIVQTIAGSIFVVGQYPVFTFIKKRLGVMGALRAGALYSNVLLLFIPIALYFSPTTRHNWYQLGYLGLVSGAAGIFGSIFMGCATIGVNGCIEQPSQRASVNGLQSMVASVGRGLGPIAAGYLVAWVMASEAISSTASAWVLYVVLVLMGMVTYASTGSIPVGGDDKR